ncbi:hypothetical protein KKA00_04900 [bacterium]|nr:hypothetical protein [bacterium]MBU1880420.1 hypothetical protein [bacterium]
MRRVILTFLILSLTAGVVWGPNLINQFTAESAEDFVILEWVSGPEAGLKEYQVERSLDGIGFIAIATLPPAGSETEYTYEDYDIYKTTTRTYYYRIHGSMLNGTSTYSDIQSVTMSFSGIQQTWGSIKSLFR